MSSEPTEPPSTVPRPVAGRVPAYLSEQVHKEYITNSSNNRIEYITNSSKNITGTLKNINYKNSSRNITTGI